MGGAGLGYDWTRSKTAVAGLTKLLDDDLWLRSQVLAAEALGQIGPEAKSAVPH